MRRTRSPTLEADTDVRWAMRNGEVRATAVTTDPMWSQLWGLPTMHVPDAWATATGAGVTVAVTDTGVEESHPDLLGQLRPDGWDFVNSDNDPADDDGHGTHVTGTIAARNGNAQGLTGTAPDATVLPLKVLDGTGHGNWADLADAWDLAGDRGVKIVNASLGGTGSIPVVNDVVAAHPNTLFVVAAGNDDVDLDLATYTPCEVPANNVLCVGASDQYDMRAYFSNYGSTGVDVYAPGVDILSTWPGGGYAYLDGTSMATPNVAAVAALLLSNIPDLSPTELKAAIMNTAEDKPGLESVSGGRVNANAALAAVGTDRDGDGVENADDNCPTRRGPASNHGCPLDSDHDGVYDDLDACPSLSGPAYLAGCPVPPKPPVRDRDADGVPDDRDACPDTRAPGSPFGCLPERLRMGSVKAGGRAGRVTVKFRASRAASIKVTAERRVCRRKKCSWRTSQDGARGRLPRHGPAAPARRSLSYQGHRHRRWRARLAHQDHHRPALARPSRPGRRNPGQTEKRVTSVTDWCVAVQAGSGRPVPLVTARPRDANGTATAISNEACDDRHGSLPCRSRAARDHRTASGGVVRRSPVNEIEGGELPARGRRRANGTSAAPGAAASRASRPTSASIRGKPVSFRVDTPSSDYRLDIYRMGSTAVTGARKVATVHRHAAPTSRPVTARQRPG